MTRFTPEAATSHPPEFHRLCEETVRELLLLKGVDSSERGRRIPALRALLARVGVELVELDLYAPGFAAEQGSLVDASAALHSIDLDRGGAHVERYVDRAVADLRRIAGAPEGPPER